MMTEHDEDEYDEDPDVCEFCGGEGYIAAIDGDSTDWGEDTYCGPTDAVIQCRFCKGTGAP